MRLLCTICLTTSLLASLSWVQAADEVPVKVKKPRSYDRSINFSQVSTPDISVTSRTKDTENEPKLLDIDRLSREAYIPNTGRPQIPNQMRPQDTPERASKPRNWILPPVSKELEDNRYNFSKDEEEEDQGWGWLEQSIRERRAMLEQEEEEEEEKEEREEDPLNQDTENLFMQDKPVEWEATPSQPQESGLMLTVPEMASLQMNADNSLLKMEPISSSELGGLDRTNQDPEPDPRQIEDRETREDYSSRDTDSPGNLPGIRSLEPSVETASPIRSQASSLENLNQRIRTSMKQNTLDTPAVNAGSGGTDRMSGFRQPLARPSFPTAGSRPGSSAVALPSNHSPVADLRGTVFGNRSSTFGSTGWGQAGSSPGSGSSLLKPGGTTSRSQPFGSPGSLQSTQPFKNLRPSPPTSLGVFGN